jgi:hypothetical protein
MASFYDIVDVSPQRDGNPLYVAAAELIEWIHYRILVAELTGIVAVLIEHGLLEITIGGDLKVMVLPYLGDDEVVKLSVLRHDEPVVNGELDARGYVSGCRNVNVAIHCDDLLAELRFLRDLFARENS